MTTLMHVVLLVAERSVHRGRILEHHAMGDDERRIDLAALDSLEQPRHVLVHVGLTHLQRQPLCERGAERELVEPPAVHTRDRHGPSLAAAR